MASVDLAKVLDSEPPLVFGEPATIYVNDDGDIVGNAFFAGEPYADIGQLLSNTDAEFGTGESPDDVILGTDDDDDIWGGVEGDDLIDAIAGNDTIGLSDGNVTVAAGSGDNFVYTAGSGAGSNTVDLGSGNDNFWATAGDNTITGSDDNLIGIGTGNDTVDTGSGDDFIYTVNGGGGTNVLNLGDGIATLWLEAGNYTITTGADADSIGLGTGTDTVNAGDGDNIIYMLDPSTSGDKDITAGSGDDYVATGAGTDRIDAGAGLNTLFGGDGLDLFVVRSGAYNFIGDFEFGVDLIGLDGLLFEELSFYQGTGDVATDAFIFVGDEAIAQVTNATIGELKDSDNFTIVGEESSVSHVSELHVFSINDVLGGFDGQTYADDPSIIALGGMPDVPALTDKDGNVLSPIDSAFDFTFQDFLGAEPKERDGEYTEGWAGNVKYDTDGNGTAEAIGIATVNAVTETFKSGQPLGTWAAGLGGNSVKASTEHYDVMAHLLSDQNYAADSSAEYVLDNDLKLVDFEDNGSGDLTEGPLHDLYVKEIVRALEVAIDNLPTDDDPTDANPQTYSDLDFDRDGNDDKYRTLTLTTEVDTDGDGTLETIKIGAVDIGANGSVDIRDSGLNGYTYADIVDVLEPNENTVTENIAYSNDYSVTLKDDGKLLYRWGTEVKRPTDIRMDIKLDLPETWTSTADEDGNGTPDVLELNDGRGYRLTRAELIVNHNVTNNPNDQIRPEDYENEAAAGRKPSYYIVQDPDNPSNTLWVSPVDTYDGSGAFLPSYFKLADAGEVDLAAGGKAVYAPDGTTLLGYRNTDADGDFIGTVLRDYSLIDKNAAAELDFTSSDLEGGFTNAYYTSTDRNPFEWSYEVESADPYRHVFAGFESREDAEAAGFTQKDFVSGPRWRLTANKFGQDIPGVEIPLIPNSQPPYQQNNIRYPVGEPVTTTLNLLDWADENGNGLADDSPLLYSNGWTLIDPTRLDVDGDGVIDEGWSEVNGNLSAGDPLPDAPIFSAVTPNGLTLTPEFFDTAVYLKGDRRDSAKVYNAQLVLEYNGAPEATEQPSVEAFVPPTGNGQGGNGSGQGGTGEGQGGTSGPAPIPPDIDEPLLDPDDVFEPATYYEASHTFSTDDVTGRFDGTTQGDLSPSDTSIVNFNAEPILTKEGVKLYPVNSEFGFNVTDFEGAEQKDFFLDPEYEEGWAGNFTDGLVVSNAATTTFQTPALLGTWLVGMGGDSVKAETEHYSVMQQVLSDQRYPGDPDALVPLDDNLIIIGGEYDGKSVKDLIDEVGDLNGDGVADIRDYLAPNENTITENIAVSSDYSVTLKDDGKLLYRWGNLVKRPTDIRLSVEMDLPDEWSETDSETGLLPLYKVSQAELVVRHTVSNNPNDQIRPEDYENEAASGRLPDYEEQPDGSWISTADYYAGDGTLYPAGTVLRDPALAEAAEGSLLDQIGALSSDLEAGLTNAWYTTQNRDPFEAVLDATNDDYEVGPRWRLKSNKYGQDLPGVEIPQDPSQPPPPKANEIKYEVGADTQTVINLLDWNGISPLTLSAGWQNGAGEVTENGLKLSENFDIAFYVKGDRKPLTLYDAKLVMSYEEVAIADVGDPVTGVPGQNVLVGRGGNIFAGNEGEEDLFVLAYGVENGTNIMPSTIANFESNLDAIGLIGLGVTEETFDQQIDQAIAGSDLILNLDGTLLATLTGVQTELDAGHFYFA